MQELSTDEKAIFDEITALGVDAWNLTQKVEGLNTDPKMFSVMIYRRLWSNHRGFAHLWNENLRLEASIILRSGLEAAICIAALSALGSEFLELMRKDAAFTVLRQSKKLREDGEEKAASVAEEHLAMLLKPLPEGTKPASLNWKDLADVGGVPQFYSTHRMLSGTSSHVTGLSIITGIISDGQSEDLQNKLSGIQGRMHPLSMAGAALHGTALHSQMIGSAELLERANGLIEKMNSLSDGWV